VARVLIVGCGCRGQGLARELVAAGHAVRGTTRDPARAGAIRAAGAEPFLADPDRVGTLMPALDAVTVACWLMGTAGAQVNGTRLRFFLEKLVDTTVRGFVYEAAGGPDGLAEARRAQQTWAIPLATIAAAPDDHGAWREAARGAVAGLLGGGGSPPLDSTETPEKR